MKTMNITNRIDQIIEENRDTYIGLSDKIWDYAETRFEEYQSAQTLSNALETEGFTVERGVGGIETAFIATYGQGSPVISILGEYDALSGMSQKPGVANKEPEKVNANGHGCGHNLLGTAPLAAAVTVKKMMEESGVKGTIKYFGCPGEEGGSGKTYMVREGLFEDIDCAVTWHPSSFNGIFTLSSLANYQVYFKFNGTAAHAANSPHLGRSALDAVELMNIGVNYLREHIIPEARVHYAVVNTGGTSPNVVQAEAEVLYLIRAPKINEVVGIYERILNIAKGAALMTDTKMEVRFDKACSNYIPNNVLGKIMHEKLESFELPSYGEVEKEFASSIQQTLTKEEIENAINEMKKSSGGKLKGKIDKTIFQETIVPYAETNEILFGSTDVGDVSWVVPTAQFFGSCFVFGTPLHSWQLVAQGSTSIAHKGMLQAGKVLASTVLEILQNPDVLNEAKQELIDKKDGIEYECPIPKGVQPSRL
jgi:aminobenzoyl-glutamate utilization protein B